MSISIEGLAELASRAILHGASRVEGSNTFAWDVNAYCENPFNRTLHARGYDKGILRKHKFAISPGSLSVHMTGLPCRKCRKCLYIRASQWRDRIVNELENAQRTWFVTLTMNPATHQRTFMEQMAIKNSSGWLDTDFDTEAMEWKLRASGASSLLTAWLKRVRSRSDYGEGIGLRYVAVTEKHKSGLPHLHLMLHETAGSLTYRRICDKWTDGYRFKGKHVAGHGFADASLVRDVKKCAWYVAKYVTKDSLTRMRASQNYGGLPDKRLADLDELYASLYALSEPRSAADRNNPFGKGPLSERIELCNKKPVL